MKSLDSAHTGLIEMTGRAASQQKAGFSAGKTAVGQFQADTPVAQWLAARTTAEVNRLVASSVQSCGVKLQERIDWRGSYEKPDGTIVPARAERKGYDAGIATHGQIEAAITKVEASMEAADDRQIKVWIAELSVITARREDSPEAESLRLAAYAGRLADYPADVVRTALLDHRWKFFPTWAELGDVCDQLIAPRQQMKKALELAAWKAREKEIRERALPTEATVTLTAEEHQERRNKSMKMAGDVLKGMQEALAAQEADEKARRDTALASYRRDAAE